MEERRPRISRRRFLTGSAVAAGGAAAGVALLRPLLSRPVRAVVPKSAAGRTVDYRWYSFFDSKMPRDVWEQRAIVGYGHVRNFDYPVTLEWAEVDGPDVIPDSGITNWAYCPGRLHITGRNIPEITIDTIGGVASPAPAGHRVGFLPYDLMGGLGATPPVGGSARLQGTIEYVGRHRAMQLRYPPIFGYHGWEAEIKSNITMDASGIQKILGISSADPQAVMSWWPGAKKDVEQAWWWWLFDEGGDVHVGGAGRKDVRYAFDTPLQMWLNSLDLQYTSSGEFVLSWDWVVMAGEMLFSRWLSEGLASGFESNSLSDVHFDLRIGAGHTDLDIDSGQDYTLYRLLRAPRWAFESYSGDVPNLTVEYLNESEYTSPGLAYADKFLGTPYTYVPSAWNLREGETLTFDWSEVDRRGGLTMKPTYVEPGPGAFPGQVQKGSRQIRYEGPIDFTAWSKTANASSWAHLADPQHPDGLLPWGEPYVEWTIEPDGSPARLFAPGKQYPRVGSKDPHRAVPPFPDPQLPQTPSLPANGRTLKTDLYAFLDPHMLPGRWRQYEDNDYQRVVSFRFPKMYRSSPYFPPDPLTLEPYSVLQSGMRIRVEGKNLSEITIDSIGGGQNPAGFLPRNLMGGLGNGVSGGTAMLHGHMGYGKRSREALYRLPEYWGYYGWENFFDAEVTMDPAGAQKVLGITGAQFDDFANWFSDNRNAVRHEWRQWLYREFRKAEPMAWFNFPLQVWGFLMDLGDVSSNGVTIKMSILNEALDVVIGRWFYQTFLPHMEASWEDLFLDMTIGADSTDLMLDGTMDWSLSAYGGRSDRKWWWEPFFGDNPYLANEYRETGSAAMAYYGKDFESVPTAWDLQPGEQLNLHYGDTGRALAEYGPTAADFPGRIVEADGFVSMTGPIDMLSWSKANFPSEWAAAGGRLPAGVPFIGVR